MEKFVPVAFYTTYYIHYFFGNHYVQLQGISFADFIFALSFIIHMYIHTLLANRLYLRIDLRLDKVAQ